MLFEKSLRRDITQVASVVFASLFAIFLTTTLIRLLGRAAGGKVDTASVLPFIAYSSVVALPALIVLTLYIAVLLAVGRSWRDSEMVIWFAAGRSLTAWGLPLLRFVLPWAIVVGLISFVGVPWANRQASELRQRFEQREDVTRIAAGQFRESASSARVFFVESVDEVRGTVGNVFVASRKGDAVTVVASAAGRIEQAGTERFLVLQKGRRYDAQLIAQPMALSSADQPDSNAYRVLEFERYGLRLDPSPPPAPERFARNLETIELLRDPVRWNLGELAWRLALPLASIGLVLIAVPLSYSNPRSGRAGNLIIALLSCAVYFNLMTLGSTWVSQGKLSFVVGAFGPHALLLLAIVWLFSRHIRVGSWTDRLRRRLHKMRRKPAADETPASGPA